MSTFGYYIQGAAYPTVTNPEGDKPVGISFSGSDSGEVNKPVSKSANFGVPVAIALLATIYFLI